MLMLIRNWIGMGVGRWELSVAVAVAVTNFNQKQKTENRQLITVRSEWLGHFQPTIFPLSVPIFCSRATLANKKISTAIGARKETNRLLVKIQQPTTNNQQPTTDNGQQTTQNTFSYARLGLPLKCTIPQNTNPDFSKMFIMAKLS